MDTTRYDPIWRAALPYLRARKTIYTSRSHTTTRCNYVRNILPPRPISCCPGSSCTMWAGQ